MMKCVILLQLGTPKELNDSAIRDYLREFLMDPRVINMPAFLRYVLVNEIIIPRRTQKVRQRYELVWDKHKGSPLKYYGDSLAVQLNLILPDDYKVFHAMRYGSSSIQSILEKAEQENPDEIIFVPLFPHETAATTGSITTEVERVLSGLSVVPAVRWLPVFKNDQKYIGIMSDRLQMKKWKSYDIVLFSFHGLPLKQIEADHRGVSCKSLGCHDLSNESNSSCYTHDCYRTAADIAKRAGISDESFSLAFQSRFGKRWIGPQTEDVLADYAHNGKSVLLIAPSFLTDCLETSWEIGISFKEMFKKAGGNTFDWVNSLNDDSDWAALLAHRIVT